MSWYCAGCEDYLDDDLEINHACPGAKVTRIELVKTTVEKVDHPLHYGGSDNPYETIKVIEAWDLDKSFNLGNAIKYIARAEKKGELLQDLKKAAWYLAREITRLEKVK